MTNEEIIEKIRTTLAEEFEIDVELIQPDASLSAENIQRAAGGKKLR